MSEDAPPTPPAEPSASHAPDAPPAERPPRERGPRGPRRDGPRERHPLPPQDPVSALERLVRHKHLTMEEGLAIGRLITGAADFAFPERPARAPAPPAEASPKESPVADAPPPPDAPPARD